jgi:pimeloyl-ACP methyl ester carboxylesterase
VRRTAIVVLAAAVIAGSGGIVWKTRSEAHRLVTNPRDIRMQPKRTPADLGLPFEDVAVTASDGVRLQGWFVPSWNGATILLVHGYKDSRANLLGVAEILYRHGYSLLLLSLRAHDTSDRELITFGDGETHDLDAGFSWLMTRAGLDASRVGIFGVSMGGTVAIKYAAENPRIRALVADCAFSSLEDTIETSVSFFTGLPPFPFAPMIEFWTEQLTGIRAEDIDAKQWIARISPRPVFLLQGGADVVISPESGARLFAAAGQPKELWLDPELGHVQFLRAHPTEFGRRVVCF